MGATRATGWQEVADWARARLAPTHGHPTIVADVALHPTLDEVALGSFVRSSFEDGGGRWVSLVQDGQVRPLREGWRPSWSPDGSVLAHLDGTGLQLGELHLRLDGVPEALAWKADGSALLVVLAEAGAAASGVAGSGTLAGGEDDAWLPVVEGTGGHQHWRRLRVVDAVTGSSRAVGREDLNVWDACWAGDQVLVLSSDGGSSESDWYSAQLRLLDPVTGAERLLVTPRDQVGRLAASPSGRHVAWVESSCSDRDIVAGDLLLLDVESEEPVRLAAPVDVSDVVFLREGELGFAGLVGLATHLGTVTTGGEVTALWESVETSTAGINPTAAFRPGRTAFVRVGHDVLPEVVLLAGGSERVLAPVVPGPEAAAATRFPGTARVHRWTAPDGLEVEGWLHLPEGPGPHPTIAFVHGGPVHSFRATWACAALMRTLLVERGYALLLPNPRGSSGRGQAFVRGVVGDMGGADAQDVLSGVTSLVEAGVADPARLGVTGGSYGGFMTAWLVTQTPMFAAAVSQFPITDWGYQHGTSNLGAWDELYLDGKPYARDGQYVARSPMTHVDAVTTPTMFLCGALDLSTPPGQTLAMHRALVARGVESVCVTYPQAGHGTRDLPSTIDSAARALAWFERHMPAARTHEERT